MSTVPASRQFALFLVAGGLAAGANVGSRLMFGQWLPYVASMLLAYCTGMITAFVLNRMFVFTSAGNPLRHQIAWFIVINMAAVLQTVAVSLFLARALLPAMGFDYNNETISHIVGVLVPVVTSYFGHKRLSFSAARETRNTNGQPC